MQTQNQSWTNDRGVASEAVIPGVTPLAVRWRKHWHSSYMAARAQGQRSRGEPWSASSRASQGLTAEEEGGEGGWSEKRSGSGGGGWATTRAGPTVPGRSAWPWCLSAWARLAPREGWGVSVAGLTLAEGGQASGLTKTDHAGQGGGDQIVFFVCKNRV